MFLKLKQCITYVLLLPFTSDEVPIVITLDVGATYELPRPRAYSLHRISQRMWITAAAGRVTRQAAMGVVVQVLHAVGGYGGGSGRDWLYLITTCTL